MTICSFYSIKSIWKFQSQKQRTEICISVWVKNEESFSTVNFSIFVSTVAFLSDYSRKRHGFYCYLRESKCKQSQCFVVVKQEFAWRLTTLCRSQPTGPSEKVCEYRQQCFGCACNLSYFTFDRKSLQTIASRKYFENKIALSKIRCDLFFSILSRTISFIEFRCTSKINRK